MSFSNVAIITGASRGIGAATAKLFAKKGYAVCINYISNDMAAEAVKNDIIKNPNAKRWASRRGR